MIFVPRHQDRARVISDGRLNEDEEEGTITCEMRRKRGQVLRNDTLLF